MRRDRRLPRNPSGAGSGSLAQAANPHRQRGRGLPVPVGHGGICGRRPQSGSYFARVDVTRIRLQVAVLEVCASLRELPDDA